MKITYGNKRIVVLVGNYAIKIGKIRLVRLISRILILPFSRRLRVRFLNKYGGTWRLAILNDMFAGLLCNRHEYTYFTNHDDNRVMPTQRLLLAGHIIVQLRGEAATHADIVTRFPLYRSKQYKEANLDKEEQYGIHPSGEVRILDYGDGLTTDFLQQVYS